MTRRQLNLPPQSPHLSVRAGRLQMNRRRCCRTHRLPRRVLSLCIAIAVYYVKAVRPASEEPVIEDAVKTIAAALKVSRPTVKNVLAEVEECFKNGTQFLGKRKPGSGGHNKL
ncbi:hypothetical protein SPRG_16321 [Saprolegnia parasitica CBS 223.65]|uniref:Uncharacterized protein n=1 Tax=Saprolegnia parasitica (strain CBS 223.65) TaxID=695850 RepID=A0A067BJE7_SAPPC|nr:hypothetical protein SPRG_16321 [Saprolegnia parasitica CBS 223.65]KDO18283.1 hypothetical protein SPRG_16321 [Saprolegnia parasitica CBS 223.65]|eukprot:XP_012211009.1 hypothetical protein SPRG_16321 [Saprolegnia parasitica CBS 223.65]